MTIPAMALTVDVEDYFQVTAFENHVPRSGWDRMPSRVQDNTVRVMEILADQGVKGTFFILGWIAEKHPELVRKIDSMGHEIASHGYNHRLVYEQTPDEFREDVRRSREILQNITGQRVLGYRAPTFSITPRSAWAHGILAEEGYVYSSSVFPVHHDRYGWPGFGNEPRWIPAGGKKGIWEFPLPFVRFAGALLPFGGGGYLRIYPLWLTMALIKMRSRQPDGRMIVYLHPWEIDADQPRLPGTTLGKLRHYWGISRLEEKVRRVLRSYRFAPLGEPFLDDSGDPPDPGPEITSCAV